VDVVDGGLAGLDLLRYVEGAKRVVFVDAVSGFARSGEVIALPAGDVAHAGPAWYDHAAGLTYLLRLLPDVCEGTIPEIFVVGIEGNADDDTIAAAADVSLRIAVRQEGAVSGGAV
jgi:hydrogenase maturation protease